MPLTTYKYEVLVTTDQDENEITHALFHAIDGAREDLGAYNPNTATVVSLYLVEP